MTVRRWHVLVAVMSVVSLIVPAGRPVTILEPPYLEWAPSPAGPWSLDGTASVTEIGEPGNRRFSVLVAAGAPTRFFRLVGIRPGTRSAAGPILDLDTVPYRPLRMEAPFGIAPTVRMEFRPDAMVLIPAGQFTMGCPLVPESRSNEFPSHTVYVSAFYLEQYEVSKALWDEVYTWAVAHGYGFDNPGTGSGPGHPVHTVNWYDAVKWCNARSEKEGLAPCYYTSPWPLVVYRTGQLDVDDSWVYWHTNGYRLPTEAEWEKAARGGLVCRVFPWGDSFWSGHADCCGFFSGTTPVDFYFENGYGLHRMADNVEEWCWDWYDTAWYVYESSRSPDTHGPSESPLDSRVARGGSWQSPAEFLRCASRGRLEPSWTMSRTGFRCVRTRL